MSLCPSGATRLCYALRNTGLPARVLLVTGGTTRVLLGSGGQRECYSSSDLRRIWPVIWLHESSGRVTTGFAGQGKIKVILTFAYFGLRIAILPRVAVLFGSFGSHCEYKRVL